MTEANIPGGFIILARRLLHSEIMDKPPLYLKLFVWMILQASHKDHGTLKRGQFFTSLEKMREAMKYKRGFNEIKPSKKEIRCILRFLTISRMTVTLKGTHGTLITILNYDHYQNVLNYEGHNEGHRQGHNINKNGIYKKGITPEEFQGLFVSLLSRYPDQDIIQKAFEAVASTRKTKRIADSVKLSILQAWEKYAIDQVQGGIRAYLGKGYADQGRKENYLLGIIRNQNGKGPNEQGQEEGFKSSGSSLLDRATRENWTPGEGRE